MLLQTYQNISWNVYVLCPNQTQNIKYFPEIFRAMWIAMLELETANIGTMPTYTTGEKSSIVNLFFVDARFSREGSYWQVTDP